MMMHLEKNHAHVMNVSVTYLIVTLHFNACKASDGIMWFCAHCRTSLPASRKFLQRLDDLESKQSNYGKQIQSL